MSLRSKKHDIVARSNAEAEFYAMALGKSVLLWQKITLDNLKITRIRSMKLFCHNKFAINIAHKLVRHDRTKHVDIDLLHKREA